MASPGVGQPGREISDGRIHDDRVDDGIFSARLRRAGVIWVCVTAPLAAIGGVFLSGEQQYLIGWTLASGLYTTPALVITWLVAGRAPREDRPFWRMMLGGLVMIYCIGLSVLALELTGWEPLRRGGAVAVCVAMLTYGVGLVMLLRSRSGHRALSVDVVETAISAVAVVSIVPMLVGRAVVEAEAAWFAVPSALATMAMITASLWSLQLLVRLGNERTSMEVMGVSLAFLGALQASVQVVEGVTNFDLPQGPVIALQCLCMGLVLLTPLHASHTLPIGLDRLPPQEQVRSGGVVAAITVASLPVLLVEVVLVAPSTPWALGYVAGVAAVLLILSTVRHLLAQQETKRLYRKVEQAAEDRRLLLARVMQGADHDRHRVAAQLHEQAASSYAAFVEFFHATCESRDEVPDPIARASARVREDLSRQAESLRKLMLAIQPIEMPAGEMAVGVGGRRKESSDLTTPITAYVHNLYGDTPAPDLHVEVCPDLVLDWNTETIVFRIVQEAVGNVWAHSRAAALRIGVGFVDDRIEVRVEDDGVGFDPNTLLFESGLATLRSFAGFTGGEVRVESQPGRGTTVIAQLGVGLSADDVTVHEVARPGDTGRVPVSEDDAWRQRVVDRYEAPGPPALRLLPGGQPTASV